MKEKSITTRSSNETKQQGALFAESLQGPCVIALYGDLGAGKTTFVQGFLSVFGIDDVISPTFLIVKQYPIDPLKIVNCKLKINYIYHIDCYRLDSGDKIKSAGLPDVINDPSALVLIEWPERIQKILPKNNSEIFFEHIKDNERKIRIAV